MAGERVRLILEKPFQMGETLNGTLDLDIEQEVKLMEKKLNELPAEKATKEEETFSMKDLGIARFENWEEVLDLYDE